MIDKTVSRYLINESVYSDVVNNKSPWVVVDMQGKIVSNENLKDYHAAYKEWEKQGKRTFIINTKLSTKNFLAIVFFPRTQKQPEPYFKYEKITDVGFSGKWQLTKDLGKATGGNGGY